MSFALFCQAKLNQMRNYHAVGSSGKTERKEGGRIRSPTATGVWRN